MFLIYEIIQQLPRLDTQNRRNHLKTTFPAVFTTKSRRNTNTSPAKSWAEVDQMH